MPAGYSSVSIRDDGTLLAASGNGKISIFQIQGNGSPVASIQVCNGPVFVVKALKSNHWASIGADGVFCIWHLEGKNLRLKWKSPPMPTVKFGAMQSIAVDNKTSSIFWGCGNGTVCKLSEANTNAKLQSWQCHTGNVMAVAWHSELNLLITAGFDDGFLRGWDVNDTTRPALEINVRAQIIGIWPMIGRKIAIIGSDGQIQCSSLENGAIPEPIAYVPARAWVGFPIEAAVERYHSEERTTITCLLERIDKNIENKQWEEAEVNIQKIHDKGYKFEALVLHAKVYRVRGQLLLEYPIWKGLKDIVTEGDLALSVHYGLGDVLMRLNEPDLAKMEFEQALDFDNAKQRVVEAGKHPLAGEKDVVRGDVYDHQSFYQEINKYITLNQRFLSPVIVFAKQVDIHVNEPNLSVEKIRSIISEHAESNGLCQVELEAHNVKVFRSADLPLDNVSWIRVKPSIDNEGIEPWFQYALGIDRDTQGYRFTAYLVLDPGSIKHTECSSTEWNHEVAACWGKGAENPAYKKWLEFVSAKVESIVRGRIGTSDDMVFG